MGRFPSTKALGYGQGGMGADILRARHPRELADERSLFPIGNDGFGAMKGHWFRAEMIEEMIRRAEVVNASTCTADDVLYSMGLDVFNAVYHRHAAALAHELVLLRGQNDTPEPRGWYFSVSHEGKRRWLVKFFTKSLHDGNIFCKLMMNKRSAQLFSTP